MVQLAYAQTHAIGFPGMIADMAIMEGISRRNDEASLSIPFGVAVVQSPTATDANGMLLPRQASFSAQAWLGVTVHDHREPVGVIGATQTAGILPVSMASILRKGRIYVTSEAAVLLADIGLPGKVRMRILASGGNTQLGAFTNAADTDVDSVALVNGAVWMSACAAGGIAVLEIPDGVTLTIGS